MLKSSSISEDVKPLEKQLVVEWKTTLSLFRSTLANYEGMCLGPKLLDGRQTLVLIADSQGGSKGRVLEYVKVIALKAE